MYKVLIPQDIMAKGKEFLKAQGYEVIIGSGWDSETIKREVKDADALLVRTALYPEDVIAAGRKLKIIARYGVGTDNIDIKAAEKQGVWVTIAKNANVHSVAEHTIALLLALSKQLVFCNEQVKSGNWEIRNSKQGIELCGKTLGVIGLGAIGLSAAKKAYFGLDMNVIGFDAFADESKLPEYIEIMPSAGEVFSKADAVSLHIPLTKGTKNIVNKELLNKMKPASFLINCARGGIVNEEDLYQALKENVIAGAAMDVFEREPADPKNKLFTLDNFIASPHNAGLTYEAGEAMALSAAEAIHDVLSGRKPKYPVNNPEF